MGGFKKKSKSNIRSLEKKIKERINSLTILKTKTTHNSSLLAHKVIRKKSKRKKRYKSQSKKKFKRKDQNISLNKFNKRKLKGKRLKYNQRMIEKKI
jgi:hypothetical protein